MFAEPIRSKQELLDLLAYWEIGKGKHKYRLSLSVITQEENDKFYYGYYNAEDFKREFDLNEGAGNE